MQAVYVTCDAPGDLDSHLGVISDVSVVAARANSLAGSFKNDDDNCPTTEVPETASA
jgi:hypothetical protein